MFTTGLEANDLAAARSAGLQPIGQVTGVSVRYSPRPGPYWTASLLSETRARALWKMKRAARGLGADLVLTVQITHRKRLMGSIAEATATGMALARTNRASVPRDPVFASLSVQEYWKLIQGGYAPVGLVTSATTVMRRQPLTGWSNREFTRLSDLVRDAYHRVRVDMHRRSRALHAEGVIAVKFDSRMERSSHYFWLTLTTTGTAIAPIRDRLGSRSRVLHLGARLLGTAPKSTDRQLQITPVRHLSAPAEGW